ncbi:MAG: AAA family ATPase [Candidatus Nitrosopolaris sp.]
MRIVQLRITNFFSYDNAKIPLENYNVIVGANASGKTNVIRILKFLSSDSNTVDDKRLPLNLKFRRDMTSSLTFDILLSEYEAKILLELIINRKIEDYSFDKNLRHITLSLEWTEIYDNDTPPDIVILYFKNHLAIWKNGASVSITYIQTFPETIEELKSDFNESVIIENDEKLKRSYREKNGISHSNLFAEKSFQDALLNGCQILEFFKVEDKRVRIAQNIFSITYNLSLANKDKEHIVEIFQFLGIEHSTKYSPHLWLLIDHFLRNITIQNEIRPELTELTKSLLL